MKVEIKTTKVYDVKYIRFNIPVDAEMDFEWANEDNEFCEKYYKNIDSLSLKIDIETGVVCGWIDQHFNEDFTIYAKVVDEGEYALYDSNDNLIASYEGYVPDILSCIDDGYGDYLSMTISPLGYIDLWCPNKLNQFIDTINGE